MPTVRLLDHLAQGANMFRNPPKYVLTIAIVVSVVRLAAFWILTIAEWTHNQSWSLVPLVLLLWPEAWLLAADAKLTGWFAVGFSVVLCAPIAVAALLEIWIASRISAARRRGRDS